MNDELSERIGYRARLGFIFIAIRGDIVVASYAGSPEHVPEDDLLELAARGV